MDRDQRKGTSSQVGGYLRALSAASVGLELAISIVIGWFVGQWLDRRLGTTPWLMIGFLLIGVAAGFRSVYTAARKAMRPDPKATPDPGHDDERRDG